MRLRGAEVGGGTRLPRRVEPWPSSRWEGARPNSHRCLLQPLRHQLVCLAEVQGHLISSRCTHHLRRYRRVHTMPKAKNRAAESRKIVHPQHPRLGTSTR